MKKTFTSILLMSLMVFVTVSCGKKEDNSLAGKKAQLVELQKQATTLTSKIQALQSELDKLEPNKEEKIKTVSVTPVITQNFQHFVEATGRLEAENNVFVSPQTGGALTKVFVKIGDFVSKGQKIATIDNSILRNSMQEVEIQLETAKTIFERQKNLWDQKIGTEVQYIQAKSAVESLERRINTLKSQDVLNVVVAPISGVVDEVRLKAGEIAAPGVGILRIVNFNELKVVANVPDTYAGTIAKGDMVKIKFPDLQKEISAKLSYVSQTINQVSRTFTVEAKVPMTDKSFKPNLTALVTINDQSTGGAIVIPQNYIQNTEQGSIVYIATTEGNKKIARAKIVKTGLSYDGKIEIKSGLTVGDALITEGYQEIVDGQAINY
ncbi:efflux RND transporter periplasmic adaptor subunit [Lacihabitans sp. CCS-44]|uniref:efflux RND transporter periplasmic adaptor subunit n=1 Tax=Lacihabitans sp. CCS-44 TaxID=2487331 RepID=UPI001B753091|nr:efflux RND transporter periplasmic adaptor subunit [Lacihabitans sp. CCS-44]MBP6618914.1 efflux RND transporter periplasmic adaptor subunit [Leadbetterella sp.]MCP9755269.1 efflux RND transporter periplasmic adaptor subunit [Lacihabitans sp. CCS-44]